MLPPIHLAFTSCGTRDDAERLGKCLVEEKLAACASVFSGVVSFYTWKDEARRDEEFVVMFKTTGPALAALEARLIELHVYECPEFVAVPAERVTEAYAAWVTESVEPPVQPA